MSNPDQSFIGVSSGKVTSFVGADATKLFQAAVLKSALSLYAKTGMRATRNASPTVMLTMAKEFTGHTFKGKTKFFDAASAVETWIHTMKAALPVIDDQTGQQIS